MNDIYGYSFLQINTHSNSNPAGCTKNRQWFKSWRFADIIVQIEAERRKKYQ